MDKNQARAAYDAASEARQKAYESLKACYKKTDEASKACDNVLIDAGEFCLDLLTNGYFCRQFPELEERILQFKDKLEAADKEHEAATAENDKASKAFHDALDAENVANHRYYQSERQS